MSRSTTVEIQPLAKWPEKSATARRNAPFRADWSATLNKLDDELTVVKARGVILNTMHSPDDVRLDGKLRSDTRRPTHPGVILTFEKYLGWDSATQQSKYVALRFPCDTFLDWKDNVRAVALALEALRKIDRYGVKTGSQYAGFKALPAAGGEVDELSPELAASFVAKCAGMGSVPSISISIIQNPVFAESVYKTAAKAVHPDKGGKAEDFAMLERAMSVVRGVWEQAKAAGT